MGCGPCQVGCTCQASGAPGACACGQGSTVLRPPRPAAKDQALSLEQPPRCEPGGRQVLRPAGPVLRPAQAAPADLLLVAGRGEIPARRLPGGSWRIDAADWHARDLAGHFDPPDRTGRPAGPTDLLKVDPLERVPLPFDPLIEAGTADLAFLVEVGYRATTFLVPLEWYLRYRSDLEEQHARLATGRDEAVGLVSSVADGERVAFDDLLAAFAVSGADPAVWMELLGCYNLPRESMPSDISAQFWANGWGPPYRTHELTLMLVLTTSRLIEDTCTGHENCEGFGAFVEALLRGRRQTDLLGAGPCNVRFRFMNYLAEDAFVADTGLTVDFAGCGFVTPTFCDRGFLVDRLDGGTEDLGNAWDFAFPAEFDRMGMQWEPAGSARPLGGETMPMPGVGTGLLAYVSNGTWTVSQRPEFLAWQGFVVDWILYCARMAFDRARDAGATLTDTERTELRAKAAALGRYALRVLVDRGRLLIHELGHVHNGAGGHCEIGECCFELAAQHWQCAVVAAWGMPIFSGTSDAARTWMDASTEADLDTCHGDDAGTAEPWMQCTLGSPGTRWGSYTFSCHGCTDTTVSTRRVLRWGEA